MTEDKKTEFLKITDIAEMLNVSRPLIRGEIAKGKLPAFQIGGVILIKRVDFEQYLESARIQPGSIDEESEELKIEDAE